jgi:WD40-like Beta Propeller Repeat
MAAGPRRRMLAAMTRRLLIFAAAAALSLAAASPAAADSISYIKDGNIWLTTPDGSRQFQVTTTGIYSYASQADDGTFIALTDERLHKLSRDGKVLADFATPVTDGPKKGPNENYFMGPYEPEISPDGTRVTYTYGWHHERFEPTCNCIEWGIDSGTAITYSDRLTPWEEFGGPLTGWVTASWMSNDTILRSYAGRAFAEEAVVNNVGPGKGDDDMISWLDSTFDMDEVYQLRDGEISRDGRKAAFVSYDVAHHGEPYRSGFNRIRVYRMTGPPPARPEACFWFNAEDVAGIMSSPSFSPDGSKIAWTYGGGIAIGDVPDLSGGCQSPSAFNAALVQGTQPDWGPADVPTGRGPACCAPEDKGGKLKLRAPKRMKLAAALKKGIVVTVSPGAAGKAAATARSGKAKVGSGKAKVGTKGRAKLRVKFTKRAKRALKRKKAVTLKVAVTFKPAAGGASTKGAATIRLKR